MKKIIVLLFVLLLSGCSVSTTDKSIDYDEKDAELLLLDGSSATLNGQKVEEYDYVWHLDPSEEEEYYTGQEPEGKEIYIAHDIIYFPELSEDSFTLENYDGEMEWVSHYTNPELLDYLFATLPRLGNTLPAEMMHSEIEAYENPVLHINKAGTYILEGNFQGQIAIDLGKDAFTDETARVTLVFNGVDITCTVAPAVVFFNVYESDNDWEEKESHDNKIDVFDAGAFVILKDGKVNHVTGANVYRLLKPNYKKEGSTVQKKRYKMDGAFYSYQSLYICGEEEGSGILNITSTTFEGLNSELHLQIDGGYITIVSQDDGINVNEDDVSVFCMNDGHLTIFAGQGIEGDVIDSNGYIVVNGGTILGTSPSVSDEILDSNNGIEVSDKATVISNGAMKNNAGPMGNDQRPDPFGQGTHPDDFNSFFYKKRPDDSMEQSPWEQPDFSPFENIPNPQGKNRYEDGQEL